MNSSFVEKGAQTASTRHHRASTLLSPWRPTLPFPKAERILTAELWLRGNLLASKPQRGAGASPSPSDPDLSLKQSASRQFTGGGIRRTKRGSSNQSGRWEKARRAGFKTEPNPATPDSRPKTKGKQGTAGRGADSGVQGFGCSEVQRRYHAARRLCTTRQPEPGTGRDLLPSPACCRELTAISVCRVWLQVAPTQLVPCLLNL